jgi:hypothetical protein
MAAESKVLPTLLKINKVNAEWDTNKRDEIYLKTYVNRDERIVSSKTRIFNESKYVKR